jgi:tetratricopeptide (TPR) repeat protein
MCIRDSTYSTISRFDLALPDYNKYLLIKPEDTKAWMWRGTALFNLQRTDEAMADFEKAHAMKMNVKAEERVSFEAEVIYWKALVMTRRQQYAEALELYNQSLALNPDRGETYGWRGIAHYNLKHYQAAIDDYTKAISMNPNDAPSYVNRAVAYYDIGPYKLSYADLNTAGQMKYPLDKDYFFKVMNAAQQQK